ncbi:hypothetical protein TrLO_g13139 [Triparma laevis f. longispina]|uniref:MPN domain-containing protein n=1 Tax=Triparma laevis f. longispina TaxID=1714387 RepID=A0A9W7CIC5_9STRA|nr:hypothetical protein TrLO_g13139 [Triparma laevis f. longispina]
MAELHIDGVALLKIITHSTNYLPQNVSGSLLGLEITDTPSGSVVHVTNSFGFPQSTSVPEQVVDAVEDEVDPAVAVRPPAEEEEKDTSNPHIVASNEAQDGYQRDMMKMLKNVNVDSNVVGWYHSTYLGTFASSTLIETQLSYQLELGDNAVVLLYDPIQTANNSQGEVVVKAYTLTKEFVEKKEKGGKEYINTKNVFKEMTVKVRNPGLVRAALFDLDRNNAPAAAGASVPRTVLTNSQYGASGEVDFDRLDLSTNPFLEKNLEFLCQWVDELSSEQSKFQVFARQLLKEEGGGQVHPIQLRGNRSNTTRVNVDKSKRWTDAEAPSRIDALLSNLQLKTYCNNVNDFAERSFSKLFLAGGLQGATN